MSGGRTMPVVIAPATIPATPHTRQGGSPQTQPQSTRGQPQSPTFALGQDRPDRLGQQ